MPLPWSRSSSPIRARQGGGTTIPRSSRTKAVGRFIGRNGKRVGITIAGFAVILAGIALLVLPGPGWLLIFAGFAILSTEYVWARRLLVKAKTKAEQAKDVVLRKKAAKAEKKAAPEDTAVPLPNDDVA